MRGGDTAPIVVSLVAGVVQAASFWPLQSWWLQLGALAVPVVLTLRTPRRAASFGFAFGLGCFTTGVSWLYISMHRYGAMPAVLAGLALLLFAAYLSAFYAIVCAALARLDTAMRARGAPPLAHAAALGLLFAGTWAMCEILRGWLFTGFPWLAIGYAQIDGPLAAYAPLLGVYGVCLLAALAACGLALAVGGLPGVHPARAARACGACLLVFPIAAGFALARLDWTSPHGAPLRVRLLQGNVAQNLKFDPQRSLAAMHAYTREILRADVPLTVLPETAWTIPWSGTPAQVREALVAHLHKTGNVVAIGMPLLQGESASGGIDDTRLLTNSVSVIDSSGTIVWRYDKHHLVPFGEFVPSGFGWFVGLMNIPLGDFGRGSVDQLPLPIRGQRVAFDICYEDLFGEEIARQVRRGATILVNVSNIAWFGDSHALPQHLQIARMRAIEMARPMLRATNTGVTAAIDARGKVLGKLPPWTTGALEADVQGTDRITPYARSGNAPTLVLSLAFVAAAGALLRDAARKARRRADRTR